MPVSMMQQSLTVQNPCHQESAACLKLIKMEIMTPTGTCNNDIYKHLLKWILTTQNSNHWALLPNPQSYTLANGYFIYVAHLNRHMAKNNCMSFESSKCTFHQWQETRNLHSMLYNQSHSVKQKRQSKDETKAAVLSKASY